MKENKWCDMWIVAVVVILTGCGSATDVGNAPSLEDDLSLVSGASVSGNYSATLEPAPINDASETPPKPGESGSQPPQNVLTYSGRCSMPVSDGVGVAAVDEEATVLEISGLLDYPGISDPIIASVESGLIYIDQSSSQTDVYCVGGISTISGSLMFHCEVTTSQATTYCYVGLESN